MHIGAYLLSWPMRSSLPNRTHRLMSAALNDGPHSQEVGLSCGRDERYGKRRVTKGWTKVRNRYREH